MESVGVLSVIFVLAVVEIEMIVLDKLSDLRDMISSTVFSLDVAC